MALEPAVDGLFVLHHLHVAALVEQGNHRLVLHGHVDGVVRLDQPAELPVAVLFLLHQGRPREADVAGVREHLPHADRQGAVIRAVALVDKHEDVRGFVLELPDVQCLVELLDQRGDDGGPLLRHQLQEAPPRCCPAGVQAAGGEGVLQLPVQVLPIRHQDDPRIDQPRIEGQVPDQHHHGQRLPRPLGVPDDAPLAAAVAVPLPDPFQRRLHHEILLVAGDLLDAAVEDGEPEGQLQQPLGTAQAEERPVLLRHQALPFRLQGVEKGAKGRELAAEEPFFLICRKRRPDDGSHVLLPIP